MFHLLAGMVGKKTVIGEGYVFWEIYNTACFSPSQVMMLQSRDDSMSRSGLEPSNMSMATQHYLKRYALDWNVSESESDQYSSALEMVDHTPANNLKSILRRAPHKQHDEEENNDGQDMSMQVLDISRLKELPKLL